MQLFMRNVSYSTQKQDIIREVSRRLHQLPFPLDPKLNFDVQLFSKGRNQGHKGIGLLTLPSDDIGDLFLQLYSRIDIHRRAILFTKSKDQDKGLIAQVAATPWEEPEEVMKRKEKLQAFSTPIPLGRISFGKYCSDGSFSAEIYRDIDGAQAIFDMESRQLCLQYPFVEVKNSDLNDWFGYLNLGPFSFNDNTDITMSANFPASSILAMGISSLSNVHRVFLESATAPVFQKESQSNVESIMAVLSNYSNPVKLERTPFFFDLKKVNAPILRGICVEFSSKHSLDDFVTRCHAMHFPDPHHRRIELRHRDIYSPTKLAALDDLMVSLPFAFAFEIDKAVQNGVLEPSEVLDLKSSIDQIQHDSAEEAADIFRYFISRLQPPSLTDPQPTKRPRRSRRGKPQPSAPSLKERLNLAHYQYDEQGPRRNSWLKASSKARAIVKTYHLIVTPSSQTLEGPSDDQPNPVLHQFGHSDSFIQVSFQDENRSKPRRDNNASIDDLLDQRYRPFLADGFRAAGRNFEFLGYSMSGLKEYSFFFVTPFQFEGAIWNAEKIRDRLGDFSHLSKRPALMGARWAQAFSTSDPTLTLTDDEIAFVPDIENSNSVFTDGVSSISAQLSRALYRDLQRSRRSARSGKVPSAFQFRLGGAKGIIVVNPNLNGRVLCLRPSQRKFKSENRTISIASTSARPIAFYLNRPLILLLEHHGVPRSSFIHLQNLAIDNVRKAKDSFSEAASLFRQHGLGQSFNLAALMNNLQSELQFNILPTDRLSFQHRLIQDAIEFGMTHVLRVIKHKARIPIPGSYTLIGVADEWGCLEEGEIFATIDDARDEVYIEVEGEIVITRSPQIHPGDIQFVNAVRKPELEHLKNVVVFSCKGNRSLPSCLGGGDLDGDIYNLILDESLYPDTNSNFTPGSYIGLPYKETPNGADCTVSDVIDFVIDYMKSDLVGQISILHMVIADVAPNGPASADCLKLAELNSHAVDFPKRGTRVETNLLPKAPGKARPDYLSGEGVNPATSERYYPSAKVLGELFRRVPLHEYIEREYGAHPTDGDKVIPALDEIGLSQLGFKADVDDDLLDEMDHIMDAYCQQILIIAQSHTISKRPNDHLSEAELVSGTIQEKWPDSKKRSNAVTAMNSEVQLLVNAIHREFVGHQLEDLDDEEDSVTELDYEDWTYTEPPDEQISKANTMFTRAYAAWIVSEDAVKDDPDLFGAQSFGLIALGVMLHQIKMLKYPDTQKWKIGSNLF